MTNMPPLFSMLWRFIEQCFTSCANHMTHGFMILQKGKEKKTIMIETCTYQVSVAAPVSFFTSVHHKFLIDCTACSTLSNCTHTDAVIPRPLVRFISRQIYRHVNLWILFATKFQLSLCISHATHALFFSHRENIFMK